MALSLTEGKPFLYIYNQTYTHTTYTFTHKICIHIQYIQIYQWRRCLWQSSSPPLPCLWVRKSQCPGIFTIQGHHIQGFSEEIFACNCRRHVLRCIDHEFVYASCAQKKEKNAKQKRRVASKLNWPPICLNLMFICIWQWKETYRYTHKHTRSALYWPPMCLRLLHTFIWLRTNTHTSTQTHRHIHKYTHARFALCCICPFAPCTYFLTIFFFALCCICAFASCTHTSSTV